MSTDLRDQIRGYTEHVESSQVPVSVAEVHVRAGETDEVMVGFESRVRSRWVPRGPWPAFVAAVLALVVFGLLVWILPGREPAQPADTVPPTTIPPEELGLLEGAYYLTSTVPDGFAVRDLDTLGGSRALYLAESGDIWLPNDGGFAIDDVSRAFSIPEGGPDVEDVVETYASGSERVTVGGRPGAILETRFSQDEVTAPLIWVLGVDELGGVFEVSAVGMSREDVLGVADGVRRVMVDDFLDLGSDVTWDVKIDYRSDGLSFQVPREIRDVAESVQVSLGADLLWPRLSSADQGTTVVTTDTGEIVESTGEPITSRSANVYMQVSDENLDEIVAEYPGAELSLAQRERRVDRYLSQVVGQVISEDPHIVQAVAGPEPGFNTGSLGEELPLVPVSSAEVVPRFVLEGGSGNQAAATADRPVVVIGTVGQPGSESVAPITAVVWFTETQTICEGTGTDEGGGSSCGFEILGQFGVASVTTGGLSNDVTYAVPLDASVVQIQTPSHKYWQRPVAGYGVVPYGDTVEQPKTLVVYDANGDEIARWDFELP